MQATNYYSISLSLLILLISANASAEIEPQPIDIGGFGVVPILKMEEKYDSNVLSSETSIKSSFLTVIGPSLTIGADIGVNRYSIQANAESGLFAGDHQDNYLDSSLKANLHHEFTLRSKIDLSGQYYRAHDARGTGYSQGSGEKLDEPDLYDGYRTNGSYTLGNSDSLGRLRFFAGHTTKTYSNRRNVTGAGDHRTSNLGTIFFYQAQPKTAMLLEFRNTQINYNQNNLALDSYENRYYLGFEWEATAITSGNARAGLLQKNFKDSTKPDFKGLSWEVGVQWHPLGYTHFTLDTNGRTEETNGVGDYIETRQGELGWKHDWTEAVRSVVHSSITEYTYHPSLSREGYGTFSIGLEYIARRWLSFNSQFEINKRLSEQLNHDFDKTILTFGLIATI